MGNRILDSQSYRIPDDFFTFEKKLVSRRKCEMQQNGNSIKAVERKPCIIYVKRLAAISFGGRRPPQEKMIKLQGYTRYTFLFSNYSAVGWTP